MFVGYVDRGGNGYTFDGKLLRKKICDGKGKPIIKENEKFLGYISTKYELSVGRFLLNPLLYSYEGDIYRTTKRLIGVREPNAGKIAMGQLPTPGGLADAWRTREVEKAGGKECFEIALNEIVKCKEDRWSILIQVPAEKKKKYWLTLQPSNSQRKALHDLLGDLV